MTENSGLRSAQWFGETGRAGMIYRSWMRGQGFTPEVFDGRPVIGIATTWSELAPCNVHWSMAATITPVWPRTYRGTLVWWSGSPAFTRTRAPDS